MHCLDLSSLAIIREEKVELSWVELGLGFDNIKVIGPEEMPILVWGRRKRPPTKLGST